MFRLGWLKTLNFLILIPLLVGLVGTGGSGAWAAGLPRLYSEVPAGSAFTYQGQLKLNGETVNGACDFLFGLWDNPVDGLQLGGNLDIPAVNLMDGYFSVSLDFGPGLFNGQARWLEVAVRCPAGSGDYEILGRQELSPSPHALYAQAAPWAGLTNMPASFSDGIDDDTLYSAGIGLLMNGVELYADTDYLQRRVSGVCSNGSAIREILPDGTVSCESAGSGDITEVIAGDGLSGGGTTGAITLTLVYSGTGTAFTVARSDHDHDAFYSLLGHTHLGSEITSPVNNAIYSTWAVTATHTLTSAFATSAGFASTAGDADTLDGQHAASFASSTHEHDADYVNEGQTDSVTSAMIVNGTVSANDLLDGSALNEILDDDGEDSGLDADLLDGQEATSFAPSTHNHDATYVNEGQTDSVTTGMITNGTVSAADLQDGTALSEILDDDGAGSSLDADLLDGQHASFYQNASNINAGALGISYYSAYTDLGSEGYLGNAAGDLALNNGTLQPSLNADAVDGYHAAAFWNISGNSGTTPGTHFLGTTDNQALEIRVNSARVLRLDPNATSPNLLGGYSGNTYQAGASGVTISGGGQSGGTNLVYDNFGTIGGGGSNNAGSNDGNPASAHYATVSGGASNSASANYSAVGGGVWNIAASTYAVVAGGYSNVAGGPNSSVVGGLSNSAAGQYAAIGGGYSNYVSAGSGAIAGGFDNDAGNYVFVGAGSLNAAPATYSVIGGGYHNTGNATYGTIGGGYQNTANGGFAVIGGGQQNSTNNQYATVGGGQQNTALGQNSTVSGGYSNDASQSYATVAGGYDNTAAAPLSFAAGNRARAVSQGAFVWGDSQAADIVSTGSNQFIARAGGRFFFLLGGMADQGGYINTSTGAYLSMGGAWVNASDRNLKENFADIDSGEILQRLAGMSIQSWNYKSEDATVRHIGPTAQDFHAAFGVGNSDTSLGTVDVDGVALASIQSLYQMVQEKDTKIAAQSEQIADLEARLSAMETRLGGQSKPLASFSMWSMLPLVFAGLLAGLWVERKRDNQ